MFLIHDLKIIYWFLLFIISNTYGANLKTKFCNYRTPTNYERVTETPRDTTGESSGSFGWCHSSVSAGAHSNCRLYTHCCKHHNYVGTMDIVAITLDHLSGTVGATHVDLYTASITCHRYHFIDL